MSDITTRASFDFVRYSNCWEDPEILLEAMEIDATSVCLSIASGGDNSLAMLARDPALVVAIDVSAAQLACVELKCAAIRELDYEDFLAFLGFRASGTRAATYARLRTSLPADARTFWDARPQLVVDGIIHCGKFEKYFHRFRRYVLPLVHARRDTAQLLTRKTEAERNDFYERRWDTWRWRAMFRMFFSEFVMGKLGRDPEFFEYVEGSVSDRILARVRHALTTLPGESNPFMTYILTGNFGNALPLYAREETYTTIRANLDRLKLVHGTIDEAGDHRYDACNLSDIFEYMDDRVFGEVALDLLNRCSDGARLAYWNMLVPRSIAARFPDRVTSDEALARQLHRRDQAFFYQSFHVDRVDVA